MMMLNSKPTNVSLAILMALALTSPFSASAQVREINPTGGTATADSGLRVEVGDTGQIQIWRGGAGQLFSAVDSPPNILLLNGVLLAVGSTVYGPSHDLSSFTTWTAGGQSAVIGAGTRADPFRVTTTLMGGGFSVNFTITYVHPDDEFICDIEVIPPAGNTEVIKLYHVMDTFLAGSDLGPAHVQPSAANPAVVGVRREAMPAVFEGFIRMSDPWDHFYSGHYRDIVATEPLEGADLSDTIDTDPMTDNGIGVQWTHGVITSPITVRYRLSFSDRFCTVGIDSVDPGCIAAVPACDPISLICVDCTADRHCSGGAVCDTARSTCQACLDDAAAGSMDTGCSGATPACDTSGGSNVCVQCVADGDCTGADICFADRMCRPAPMPDAGMPDAGMPDAGTPDSGMPDAGVVIADAGTAMSDAGMPDSGPVARDAGMRDAGRDFGPIPDSGPHPDGGMRDAGTTSALPDGSASPGGAVGGACVSSVAGRKGPSHWAFAIAGVFGLIVIRRRRR